MARAPAVLALLAALALATPLAAEQAAVETGRAHLGYAGRNPFAGGALATVAANGIAVPLAWADPADAAALAGCAFGARGGAMTVGDACPAQLVVDVLTDGNEATYLVRRVLAVGAPGEVLWIPDGGS